jgi:uncharacterized OB-fold protein
MTSEDKGGRKPDHPYHGPLPDITWPQAREYWEGAKNHELRIQRCSDCGTFRWYPKPMCPQCRSMRAQWAKVNGTGKVFSYTIGYRGFGNDWLKDRLPLIVAVVALDEIPHVRLLTNILECTPEEVRVDLPVEVTFEDVTRDVTLPQFKPIRGNAR